MTAGSDTPTAGFAVREVARDDAARRYEVVPEAHAFFFDGHFPGAPVLPGVAQLAQLAVPLARAAWPELDGLRRVSRLKFHRLVGPGEALTLRLTRPAPTRVEFALARGDDPVSAGSLEFGAAP